MLLCLDICKKLLSLRNLYLIFKELKIRDTVLIKSERLKILSFYKKSGQFR